MTRKYNTGRLNALVEIRNGWRRGQRQKIAQRMGPSRIGTEPHWACPSCEIPCYCEGAARSLPHRDCGDSSMSWPAKGRRAPASG